MFPIQDSVPSRSVPVVTRALILINAIVFFFELSLPQASVEQLFYLFGIVPARFTHPDWAAYVGFPVDSYWPFLTHQLLHGGWLHIIFNMWTLWIFGDNVEDRMAAAVWNFLSHVRHSRGRHPITDKSRLNGAVRRSLRRNRGRARCLPAIFSDGAAGSAVSNLLFPLLLGGTGGVVSGILVLQPVV